MDQVRGPRVQFCATCVYIARRPSEHGGPTTHVCTRLGYRTSPRYSFHCWTPRPPYRWTVETEQDRDP